MITGHFIKSHLILNAGNSALSRFFPGNVLFVSLLVFFVIINSGSNGEPGTPLHYYFTKKEHKKAAHWSYEGDTGPENWGELSSSYILARTGRKQSPVNIETKAVKTAALPDLILRYRGERPVFVNNGHTLQHDKGNDGSEFEVGGKHYRLEQFHLHSPSEHTVDGQHFPLELHLVHKSADGEVAVIAVFFKEGNESKALKLAADVHIPDKEGEEMKMKQDIKLRELLPAEPHYFTYSGSFTTPPCTEDVRWFILKYCVEASAPLLRELANALHSNNRPVQKLNERVIQGH